MVYQEGRAGEVLEFEYWASPTFMALYVERFKNRVLCFGAYLCCDVVCVVL